MPNFLAQFLKVAGVLAMASVAFAQPRTGLPFDLDYLMSKQEVLTHMKAMAMYRVDSGNVNEIAYVIAAQDTNTKNGLVLEFSGDKLVEISSMKAEMNQQMYDRYLKELLSQASIWKAAGMDAVMEDQANAFYLYKDLKSYVSISGNKGGNSKDKYMVTISFTYGPHFEKTTLGPQ